MSGSLYKTLLLIQFALSPLIFLLLLKITAPYGRFSRRGWGPAIASRWAWLFMEMPSFLIPLIITMRHPINVNNLLFLSIWFIHYFHRTFIYPFMISDPQKPFSLIIMIWGGIFNAMNSYINFYWIMDLLPLQREFRFTHWNVICGLLMFFLGFLINKHSDRILKKLRKKNELNYSIPYGGLYRFISSPNYFGEILQWGGWALLLFSPAGLAFCLFTAANLVPRALKNHKWYKDYFAEYPTDRKAIIPFLL